MFDFHMHSNFSSDAEFTMESMIQSAIAQGFKEIAITDHVDYDYTDPTISFDIDHPAYKAEISRLRQLYGQEITLRHGLELGLQPTLLEKCAALVQQEKPDFVLCSIHTCKALDLYRGDYYVGRTPEAAWTDYLEELLHIVNHYDAFNVIGHLDILRRYNAATAAYPKASLREGFDAIFKVLAAKGKGLEINTSGYRNPEEMPLPSWELLQWYQEAGGQILTMGSDAHSPDSVGFRFPETLERIRSMGFKTLCTFSNMEPTFHLI